MFRMAVGHSDDVDPESAAETIVAQCKQALNGMEPKAGLLFCTFDTDHQAVLGGVRKGFPDIALIGSTSSGEMSSVLGFREDSVTLSLFASEEVDFTAGLGTDLSIDIQSAARQAVEQARRGTEKEPRLCITTPAIRIGNPTALLHHLHSEIGEGVEVFGGGAVAQTTRGAGADAYQFFNDTVTPPRNPHRYRGADDARGLRSCHAHLRLLLLGGDRSARIVRTCAFPQRDHRRHPPGRQLGGGWRNARPRSSATGSREGEPPSFLETCSASGQRAPDGRDPGFELQAPVRN
jgi:hypothetical protein